MLNAPTIVKTRIGMSLLKLREDAVPGELLIRITAHAVGGEGGRPRSPWGVRTHH